MIHAGTLEIEVGGQINANTFGPGDGGTITVDANSLVIGSGGIINAGTSGAGDAGAIAIQAESVRIGPGRAAINVGSSRPSDAPPDFVAGNAGTIDVVATDSIFLTNEGGEHHSLLESLEGCLFTGIFSATVEGGDSGSITLSAPQITVTDGSLIATSTVGGGNAGTVLLRGNRILVANGGSVDSTSLPHPGSLRPSGDAGSVELVATGSIEVVGRTPEFGASRVSSLSVGSGAAGHVALTAPRIVVDAGAVATTAVPSGDSEGTRGGDITLEAEELLVENGGRVDASTFIGGPGGRVDVRADESIVVQGEGSGIASRTGGRGTGGGVTLRAPVIELNQEAEVSANSNRGLGEMGEIFALSILDGLIRVPANADATGDAGSVTLVADKLRLTSGTLATNAEAADGGNVTVQARDLVHLDASEITAAVSDGAGGNTTLDPQVVVLQNGSRIVADAGAGSGGNIQITADNYFAFPGTVVDASSELGVDGIVEVHAPDVDLAGKITALPSTPLDAASLMKEPCAARRSGERAGSFSVRGNGGIPAEPDGWLPASVAFDATSDATAALEPPTPQSAPVLASGSCK